MSDPSEIDIVSILTGRAAELRERIAGKQVTLTDSDFDDMHHAIGRKGLARAYRNYYCTPVESDTARRFEETGCWDLRSTINDGRDAIYSVNIRGLEELERWLHVVENRAATGGGE